MRLWVDLARPTALFPPPYTGRTRSTGDIDIGLAFEDALSAEVGDSAEILKLDLGSMCMRLLVGRGHPLAAREGRVAAAELAPLGFALLAPEFLVRQHVDRYCAANRVRLEMRFESNSLGLILNTVARGHLASFAMGDFLNADPRFRLLELSPEIQAQDLAAARRCQREACKLRCLRRDGATGLRALARG